MTMTATTARRAMRFTAIACIFLALSPSVAKGSEISFSKTENQELKETIYAAQSDQCEITWTSQKTDEGSGFGVSERSKCALELSDQKPFRAMLLEKLSEDTNGLESLRSFYWGRLQRSDATSQYASRLARAASQSSNWNSAKGKLVDYPSGLNAFVIDILNKTNAFKELDEVFAQHGLSLRAHDAEKVIVSNKELATGKKLVGKFPVDCILTFSVRPNKESAPQ